MCSYNSINGVPSCGNPWLLDEVARKDWGFDGCTCWRYIPFPCIATSTTVTAASGGVGAADAVLTQISPLTATPTPTAPCPRPSTSACAATARAWTPSGAAQVCPRTLASALLGGAPRRRPTEPARLRRPAHLSLPETRCRQAIAAATRGRLLRAARPSPRP